MGVGWDIRFTLGGNQSRGTNLNHFSNADRAESTLSVPTYLHLSHFPLILFSKPFLTEVISGSRFSHTGEKTASAWESMHLKSTDKSRSFFFSRSSQSGTLAERSSETCAMRSMLATSQTLFRECKDISTALTYSITKVG